MTNTRILGALCHPTCRDVITLFPLSLSSSPLPPLLLFPSSSPPPPFPPLSLQHFFENTLLPSFATFGSGVRDPGSGIGRD